MRKIFICICILSTTISTAQNINTGLIACYPFTGNANDMSGYYHNGIVHGAILTADRFGIANRAYEFDGLNDYIDIGALSGFTNSNEFSISVWIQPNMVKLQTILFLNPDDFSDRLNAMAYYSHNGVSSTVWDYGNCTNGGRLMQVGTTFSNAWQHWVYTVSPTNGMHIYKNGVLDLSQNSSSSIVNRQRNLWIGGGVDVNSAQFYFDGVIDDMRLYERELTAAEAQILYGVELLCQPTLVEEPKLNPKDFEVTTHGNKIKVVAHQNISSTEFSLFNSLGKCVFKKSEIKGGDTFEIPVANVAAGILIYSFQGLLNSVSGKILVGM